MARNAGTHLDSGARPISQMDILPKGNRFLAIRLGVGVIVLAVLVARLDLANLMESARRSLPWLLVITSLMVASKLLIAAKRWQLACGGRAEKGSYWRFYAWYMEGAFFNIFVPSQGGDAVRAWRLAARTGDGALAMSTVIAERVLGLVAMIILAGTGLLLYNHGSLMPGIGFSFLSAAAVLAVVLACLFHHGLNRMLIRFLIEKKWSKPAGFINRCADAFAVLSQRPGILAGIVLYSWAMQLTDITAIYLTGLAISISVPFTYCLLVVPIVWMVVMIPVTLNGLGTREAANIILFGAIGISAESALLLSVIWFGQMFLLGLLGGFFHLWLTFKETKPAADETGFNMDIPKRRLTK